MEINITIELPEDIKSNQHYKVYTKLTQDGHVIERYERAPHPNDTLVKEGTRLRPIYFGAWARVGRDDIDKLNKEIDNKRKKTRRIKILDDFDDELDDELLIAERDEEIAKVKALLAKLKEAVGE